MRKCTKLERLGVPIHALGTICVVSLFGCTEPDPLLTDGSLAEGPLGETVRSAVTVRELALKSPLDIRVITRSDLRDMMRKEAETKVHLPDWIAYEQALISLGVWLKQYDMASAYVAVAVPTTSGAYSPSHRALFVVTDPPRSLNQGPIHLSSLGDIENRITLAHEVIHALQHMHYPALFETKSPIWTYQDDASFAARAALEGDATFFAIVASIGYMGTPMDGEEYLEIALERARTSKVGPLAEAPILTRESRVYPYAYGYRMAESEGRELLEDPPASSEQVIHPTRRHEEFLAMDLSKYRGRLKGRGCKLLYENTLGELSLSLLLRSYEADLEAEVWEGWDGDRYVTASCNGEREFVWMTKWDTREDALQFERTYKRITALHRARAGLGHEPAVRRLQDSLVVVVSAGMRDDVDTAVSLARNRRVSTRAELAMHLSGANR